MEARMTTFLIKMKPKRKHFSRAGEPLKIFALKQSNLISSFWRERRESQNVRLQSLEMLKRSLVYLTTIGHGLLHSYHSPLFLREIFRLTHVLTHTHPRTHPCTHTRAHTHYWFPVQILIYILVILSKSAQLEYFCILLNKHS